MKPTICSLGTHEDSRSPPLQMADMVGVGSITPLYQNGPEFKSARRMMASFMGSWTAIERFKPTFERETSRILKGLVEEPNNVVGNVRRFVQIIELLFHYDQYMK